MVVTLKKSVAKNTKTLILPSEMTHIFSSAYAFFENLPKTKTDTQVNNVTADDTTSTNPWKES